MFVKICRKWSLNLPTLKVVDYNIFCSFNLKTKGLQIVKGVGKIFGVQNGQVKLPQ